jgi:hypothetical protein
MHIRKILLAATVTSLLAAPAALARPLDGGERNPSNNASAGYNRETQIIGDIAQNQGGYATTTGGYVTRQSNKSDTGGGAIYGCRARAGAESCVAANNLASGDAFRFQATPNSATIGQLRFGLDINKTVDKPPFVTNATGVVKNLNADRVDGKSADDFVEKGSLLFAFVNDDGAVGPNRGVAAGQKATVSESDGNRVYSVPFSGDLSQCVATANPTQVVAGETTSPLVVAIGSPATTVTVIEQGAADNPYDFSLQVTC